MLTPMSFAVLCWTVFNSVDDRHQQGDELLEIAEACNLLTAPALLFDHV
jgi:hypothetical protein